MHACKKNSMEGIPLVWIAPAVHAVHQYPCPRSMTPERFIDEIARWFQERRYIGIQLVGNGAMVPFLTVPTTALGLAASFAVQAQARVGIYSSFVGGGEFASWG